MFYIKDDLTQIKFTFYLKRSASFKWKHGCCSVLRSPIILKHRVTDYHFFVVFIEAGIEVEGNILPFLEIYVKSARDKNVAAALCHGTDSRLLRKKSQELIKASRTFLDMLMLLHVTCCLKLEEKAQSWKFAFECCCQFPI